MKQSSFLFPLIYMSKNRNVSTRGLTSLSRSSDGTRLFRWKNAVDAKQLGFLPESQKFWNSCLTGCGSLKLETKGDIVEHAYIYIYIYIKPTLNLVPTSLETIPQILSWSSTQACPMTSLQHHPNIDHLTFPKPISPSCTPNFHTQVIGCPLQSIDEFAMLPSRNLP